MKLFVWEDSLCDHTCGVMFALAESVEQAREMIMGKQNREKVWIQEELEEDLTKEPKVITTPTAFIIPGGG